MTGRATASAAMRERLAPALAADLPLPGRGHTADRLAALFEWARADLEMARMAEAHHDALAIAADAEHPTVPGALYGVWAASGPDPLLLTRVDGADRLVGSVPWCTGFGIVDRALVCARQDAGPVVLVDVAIGSNVTVQGTDRWAVGAFASTATETLHFDQVLEQHSIVGEPGSYLQRPGFWHGAIGVAACWAGGLRGLFDLHLARWTRRDEHSLAHLGGAYSADRAVHAVLVAAAAEIDANPSDCPAAENRARTIRHTIERLATTAMDHLGVGAGPEPLAFDRAVAERTQQLQLYIRQCHGERDLAPVGRHLLELRG